MMLGKLYGQEKNLTTSAIARMNLFLHGAEDFHVERGDTLRLPAFYAGDSLATFDCVIANPPFSLEKWGDDVWLNDPYGRNFAGLPPAQSGDLAWVQHMIRSMARKTGRMAVVLPHGVLFRMSREGEIRRKLLAMDLLEAVIGLGQNVFYGTGLAPCVLVFRDTKPVAHRHKVLFIQQFPLMIYKSSIRLWNRRIKGAANPLCPFWAQLFAGHVSWGSGASPSILA
jgi:type I restriction enzyme M protein